MVNKKQSETFTPEPEQIQFAEIYLDYNRKDTLEDLAKEAGVSRTTVWRWFQDNNFVSWINSKKDQMLNSSLSDRYKVAIRKARAGDFQFSKLLFEMQGEYVQRSESKITQVKDDVDNLTMEELIKEFEYDLNIYRARTDKSRDNGSKSKEAKKR